MGLPAATGRYMIAWWFSSLDGPGHAECSPPKSTDHSGANRVDVAQNVEVPTRSQFGVTMTIGRSRFVRPAQMPLRLLMHWHVGSNGRLRLPGLPNKSSI